MNKRIYMVKVCDIYHFTALTDEEYNMILERMNGQKVDIDVFEYTCGTVCSMHAVEEIIDFENKFDIDTPLNFRSVYDDNGMVYAA